MNQLHSKMPDAVPGYHSPMTAKFPPLFPPLFPPPKRPLYGQIPVRNSQSVGGIHSGRTGSFEVHRSDLDTSVDPSVGQPASRDSKDAELEEQKVRPKMTRPEVRFTLPNVNLTSSVQDPPKGAAQPSPTKPNVSTTTKLDDEYLKLCQKRDSLHRKKEAAADCGHYDVVADITSYAIPNVEKEIKEIKKLRWQQHEEKKKKKQATNAP